MATQRNTMSLTIRGEHVTAAMTLHEIEAARQHLLAQRPNILPAAAEAIGRLPESMREKAWAAALEAASQPALTIKEVIDFATKDPAGIVILYQSAVEREHPGRFTKQEIADAVQQVFTVPPEAQGLVDAPIEVQS